MARSRFPQSPKQRMRSFSRYKRSETARLIRGAIDAGLTVRGIEVETDTGRLRVLTGEPGEPSNDLDNWLNKKDARPA